jgi:hypothetical protein
MSPPAGDAAAQDQIQKIIETREEWVGNHTPGPYLYWLLAQHVRPEDIVFSDWYCTPDSQFASRTGRIFVVTARAVVFVDFENAVEEETGDPRQGFGDATITWHARVPTQPLTVTWDKRNLYAKSVRIEAGAISVDADSWSVSLPFSKRTKGADTYFSNLLAVFGLTESTT